MRRREGDGDDRRGRDRREVSHEATSVTRVEDPTERFREVVSGIDDPRDMAKSDETIFFPILNRKILNQDMPRAIGRHASVDHVDGGLVVTEQRGRIGLRKTEFVEDRP
jgi:hypothetical protein